MTPDVLTIAAQFLAADPEFLRLPADSRRLRTGRRFVGVERDPGFHASALEQMQAEVRR